jgi:hypothetical protein
MNISFVIATLCGLFNFSSTPAVQGDYVEARTASVFAGACHYNGELVTTGRDAIMAWNIASGSADGVNIAGAKMVAVISSEENLSDIGAARKCEIMIDSGASEAQAAAMVQILSGRYGKALGQILSVRRGTVIFKHESGQYEVEARGFASLSVAAMPNNECCKQPNLVWYSPLIQLTGRKVGYTHIAAYSAGTMGDSWQRSDENSAFYGSFSF